MDFLKDLWGFLKTRKKFWLDRARTAAIAKHTNAFCNYNLSGKYQYNIYNLSHHSYQL